MFGEEIIIISGILKTLRPARILNPGKIIDAPP